MFLLIKKQEQYIYIEYLKKKDPFVRELLVVAPESQETSAVSFDTSKKLLFSPIISLFIFAFF